MTLIRTLAAGTVAFMLGFPGPGAVVEAAPAMVEDSVGCPALKPIEAWGAASIANFEGDFSAFCGDFTGDGKADAIAILRSPTGGNSSYQDAVLFQNSGGRLVFLRRVPELYGEVRRAGFASGSILLEIAVMKAGDPRCCPSGIERRTVNVASGKHAVAGVPSPAAAPRPAAASAAAPDDRRAVRVRLVVSPRAAAAAGRRTGNLNAWWGGKPVAAKRAAAMRAGLLGEETEIVLGGFDRDIPLRSSEHVLAPSSWEARYESWISPLEVSVYLDTAAFPSVNCSGGTVPLAQARAQGVTIACKLAGEK